MKTLFLFISIVAATFISINLHAQNGKTIVRIEEAEQACLDSGVNMLGCAKKFYFQMDSLLNVVYSNLRLTLDSSQKAVLKKEQQLWLIKRDAYFKKTFAVFKKKNPDRWEDTAQDDAMLMYESNSEFVKNRILYLMWKLKK
jgi:uncharacterized protein YecT (DUF1311 family)